PSCLLESSSSSTPSPRSSCAHSSIVADRRIPVQICRCSHRVVLFSTPPPVVTSSPVTTAVFRLSRFSPSVKIVASPFRSAVARCPNPLVKLTKWPMKIGMRGTFFSRRRQVATFLSFLLITATVYQKNLKIAHLIGYTGPKRANLTLLIQLIILKRNASETVLVWLAYSNSDTRGSGGGCAMWFGDLNDLRVHLADAEHDLYVRVPASVL
ncbi:hypothetical protein S83_063067, partial [Arachis hypogaea]